MKTQKIYRLGIDIGGTNTEMGIVDESGKIVARKKIPTTGHNSLSKYISLLGECFREMKLSLPENALVVSAGIGAPCANSTSGCIEGATNLPWKGIIPLASLCEDEFGLPVRISNDANAAAAGERMYGVAKGIDNFIMLTLGTGVGSGIVCDGHLLSGSRGFAGELGHVTLGEGYDRECPCGRKGCLQTYAQAEGIVRTAIEILEDKSIPSEMRNIPAEELTPKLICEFAEKGDEAAILTFRKTGGILGIATANFLAFTDPEAVVLFGGIAKAGKLLTDPMKEAMNRNALFLYKDKVEILTSSLDGADAAIIGASAL